MGEQIFTPALTYDDPKAATVWLADAFGFELTMAIDGPDDAPEMSHYEMASPGGGRIMLGGSWADWTRSPVSIGGTNTQSLHVHLSSGLDEHCEHARAAGAQIIAEPSDEFYGDRTYRAVDPGGHCWTFAMHVRDVTRQEAEEAIGAPIMATDWR